MTLIQAAYAVIQIKELLLLSYELIYAYVKSSSIKPCCSLNMQAGWKLWPFAHLITYGVIPVEQRLLWVDCVELIWVTILSTWVFNTVYFELLYRRMLRAEEWRTLLSMIYFPLEKDMENELKDEPILSDPSYLKYCLRKIDICLVFLAYLRFTWRV